MIGRVIQGFFAGGTMRAMPGVLQLTAPATGSAASAIQPKSASGCPASKRLAPPGPPRPAHSGSVTIAQRHGGNGNFEVDATRLGLARGGGVPLPSVLLARMEAAFGTDFSAVRVHVGPQAARIGALAFTTGNDLYFAPGRYQPDSVQGQQLIGHELTHVIQQRQGRVRASGGRVSVVQDRLLEAEADRLGMRAAMTIQQKRIIQPFEKRMPSPGRPPLAHHARAPGSRALQRSSEAKTNASSSTNSAAMPVHTVYRSVTPEIYWFTAAAIAKGAPTTLTYVEDKTSTIYAQNAANQLVTIASLEETAARTEVTIRDVARAKVFNLGTQLKGARKSWKDGFSRDEYPYASTLECGTDAYWAYVPVSEQSSQGGSLGGLYRKLKNGDKFRVVLAE